MVVTSMRGLARRFIPEMLQKGMSAGGGLTFLRGMNMGYRRTDFLKDFREFAGREMKRDPLKAIPKKFRPDVNTIQESEYKQRAKFNYNYKIEGHDVFTGKDVDEWVTVASEVRISMDEAMSEAERLLEKYKSEIKVKGLTIDAVTSKKAESKT